MDKLVTAFAAELRERDLPAARTAATLLERLTNTRTPRHTDPLYASNERHAARTGAQPLLALWVWLGDLNFDSYGIDGV